MKHYEKFKGLLEKYQQTVQKGQSISAKILEKQCADQLEKSAELQECGDAAYRLACYLATKDLLTGAFSFPDKGSKQFSKVMELIKQGARAQHPAASYHCGCAFLLFGEQLSTVRSDEANAFLLCACQNLAHLQENCDPVEKLVELNRKTQWIYRGGLRSVLAVQSTDYLAHKGYYYDYLLICAMDEQWDNAFSMLDRSGLSDTVYCKYLIKLTDECKVQDKAGKAVLDGKKVLPARKKLLDLLERNLPQERLDILQWRWYKVLREQYTNLKMYTAAQVKNAVILRECAFLERILPTDPADIPKWEDADILAENYRVLEETDKQVWLHTMLAESGRAVSNRILGDICFAKQDYEQAVSWYRKGVLAGDSLSAPKLTQCMQQGKGITAEEGFAWYAEQAKRGNALARGQEGHCRLHGIGVQRDPENAFKTILEAVKNGHKELENDLIECYVEGIGTPVNYRAALEYMKDDEPKMPVIVIRLDYLWRPTQWNDWTRRMALRGRCFYGLEEYENALPLLEAVEPYTPNAGDLDLLAQMHLHNQGFVDIPPSPWWEKGLRISQSNHRTARSDTFAVSLLRKAADMGYGPSMCALGWCYNFGRGVAKDDAEAVKWYRKSNTPTAKYNLGTCFENGQGVEKDLGTALLWYRKAAQEGYEKAKARVPVIEAMIKNQQEEQAKQQEKAAAQELFEEGYRYEMGIGVEVDIVQAAQRYVEASQKGHEEASKRAEALLPALMKIKKDLESGKTTYKPQTAPKVTPNKDGADTFDARKELENLIGLDSVKKEITTLENMIKANARLTAMGIPPVDVAKHMVFTGNPGTGKTTVARIVAQILKENGILSKGQLVETNRGGLVGQYIGHTDPKTRAKVKEAIGGVLFIDEAYSLVPEDDGKDFGPEAVAALLTMMEDHRDDLVVIVAGYKEEMHRFIDSNPGLKSRFATFIDFPDYTPEQMQQIFERTAEKHKRILDEGIKPKLMSLWELSGSYKNNGNGRAVRKVFERTILRQANRIVRDDLRDDQQLRTILPEDIPDPEEVLQ